MTLSELDRCLYLETKEQPLLIFAFQSRDFMELPSAKDSLCVRYSLRDDMKLLLCTFKMAKSHEKKVVTKK